MEIKICNCLTEDEVKGAVIEEIIAESDMLLIKTNKGILYANLYEDNDPHWSTKYFFHRTKVAISDNVVYDPDDCNSRMETISLDEGLRYGLVDQEYVNYWEKKDEEEEWADRKDQLKQRIERAEDELKKCKEEMKSL